jgi:hypothetical protein
MTPERRPSFARTFPRVPELDALVVAFERGDYAMVRAKAPKIVASSEDEDVKRAARTLVDRTKPDALATALLALAALFVGLLSTWWIVHGHAPARSAPPVEFVR